MNYTHEEIISALTVIKETCENHKDGTCNDCAEYDHERHCCPRFNRVIRNTIDEYRETMEDDCK